VNIIADASVSQQYPPTDALNKTRFITIVKTTGNKIMEQVHSFNYLGDLISYDKEVYIDNKLDNYMKKQALATTRLDHTKLQRKHK
jgi:hypothetical protein